MRDLATAVETKIALLLSRRETHLGRERLLHVLDGAANTMVVIAKADGFIAMMNRRAAELLGRDATSFVGFWTLADLATLTQPHGPPAAPGKAQDWTLLKADGQQRVVSMRNSTLLRQRRRRGLRAGRRRRQRAPTPPWPTWGQTS